MNRSIDKGTCKINGSLHRKDLLEKAHHSTSKVITKSSKVHYNKGSERDIF